MAYTNRLKRAAVIVSGLASLAVFSYTPAATAALRYPDLRTLTPTDVHLGQALVGTEHNYVVRFSNWVANAGTGPLELHGTPRFPPDGQFDATQWIYDDPAGVSIHNVGSFAFHPSHQHFHFDDFARYELWSARDFERAATRNFTTGGPLHVSEKVSFCVLDLAHVEEDTGPPVAVYQTCTPAVEGISSGWADVYHWQLPDQFVAVGRKPLPDNRYVIRSVVDPNHVLIESENPTDPARETDLANSAVRYFTIENGRVIDGP